MSVFESKPEPEQDPLFLPPGTREWEKQERKDAGWSRVTLAFVGFIFAAFLVSGYLHLVGSSIEAANNALCKNHLMQIGLALHNYHSTHGCFPPAYTVDNQGRKMHSWRALLLPYFESSEMTTKYDLNEPWDGPNNRKLWEEMPEMYRCPSGDDSPPNTTSYAAVVGAVTMWPGVKSVSAADISDGLSNTIAIVESHNAAIPWLEPRDLDFSSMSMQINDKSAKNDISSPHPEGANVLFAHGGPKFLVRGLDAELLKALLTIAGGEPVDLR